MTPSPVTHPPHLPARPRRRRLNWRRSKRIQPSPLVSKRLHGLSTLRSLGSSCDPRLSRKATMPMRRIGSRWAWAVRRSSSGESARTGASSQRMQSILCTRSSHSTTTSIWTTSTNDAKLGSPRSLRAARLVRHQALSRNSSVTSTRASSAPQC
jgi:hypothetical protein